MSTIVNMVVLSIQTFPVPTAMKNLKVAYSLLNNIVETILNNINCWSNNVGPTMLLKHNQSIYFLYCTINS